MLREIYFIPRMYIMVNCLDFKCSSCCDPVKMKYPPGRRDEWLSWFSVPQNNAGEKIWIPLEGNRAPKWVSRNIRLQLYTCINFDKENGLCKDYDNRPDQCRNTNCKIPWPVEICEVDDSSVVFTYIGPTKPRDLSIDGLPLHQDNYRDEHPEEF